MTTLMTRLLPSLSLLAQEAESLLLPRACAGCGRPDDLLCPRCTSLFQQRLARDLPLPLVASGCLVSCAPYSGCARSAILEWKDHGDVEVGRVFQQCCAELVDWLLERPDCQSVHWVGSAGRTVAVVPAPSSRASLAARGRLQTHELAAAVVRRLAQHGLTAQEVQGLSLGERRKSVELAGSRARGKRSARALSVRRQRFPLTCAGVVLVDDIVTTGSTLLGCARALQAAGLPVLAALTLAGVPE